MYDLTASEKANKSALILVHDKYAKNLAPFVKSSKTRYEYVQGDLDKIIEDVCKETGADPDWVRERFSALDTVLEKDNTKSEKVDSKPDGPYTNNSEYNPEGIKNDDVADRGEVVGLGREEALKADATQDLNEETASETGVTEVDNKTAALIKEAMTSRDFRLIAGILASTGASPEQIEAFAQELAKTNPMFDYDRFVAAAQGSPMSGRDAPGYRPYSCFRCGKDTASKLSKVCKECNQELLKLALPQPDGTDGSQGIGTGAEGPGVQELPSPINPNVPYACTLCEREFPSREEVLGHIHTDHADVLQRQLRDRGTENMGQDNLGVTAPLASTKEADVPQPTDEAAEIAPLPENPGDRFDEYVQKMAETAAARRFSQASDEDIHSIASQIGQSPDDVKNALVVVAVFGDQTGVNGQIGADPTPPEGYQDAPVQGLTGQQDTHEALIPTDSVVKYVADDLNMSPELAYNQVKDKYGADLPEKYHASISGQVHYYLPAEMAQAAAQQQQAQQPPMQQQMAPPQQQAPPMQQPPQPNQPTM